MEYSIEKWEAMDLLVHEKSFNADTSEKEIPKFWDEGEKERYLSHQWIKAPKPWIDPVKESTADRTALETGQKTFKQVCSENGKDWRIQLDDMAEVNAYAAGLGIDLNSILFGTAKSDNSSNLLNDDEDK